MLKQFRYTSILGWSITRYNEFTLCKRRYYYQYYFKHDREVPRARIEALRSLVSIPLAIGSVTHDVITALLKRWMVAQDVLDRERFFNYARDRVEDYLTQAAFQEIHYGEREGVEADEIYESVEEALENLLASERYAWISREAVVDHDRWIIDPPGYGETRIGGLKAYVKVDFLFPNGDEIYILDWKTGKRDDIKHRKQLAGYTAWASYHLERPVETIRPIIAYLLPRYEERRLEVSPVEVAAFEDLVRRESEAMYAYCRDVEKNLPLEKREFPKTDRRGICEVCKFRELCW